MVGSKDVASIEIPAKLQSYKMRIMRDKLCMAEKLCRMRSSGQR